MKKFINLCMLVVSVVASNLLKAQPNPGANRTIPAQGVTSVTSIKSSYLLKPASIGAFSTKFSNTATGRNDINAYLLCYLSTLVYPQYLGMVAGNTTKTYEERLHTNPNDFETEYIRLTKHLFTSPEFKFFHKSDRLGYDPEAMVINTATTLFIVFRGTDRVGSNKPSAGFFSGLKYDWAEWIKTDFDARQITDPDLPGKVLSGMWGSLNHEGFKDELYNYINSKGAKTKKVWITGHSLGAGQAQLFSMYLAKKGVEAQGVYVYAAPHTGDAVFTAAIDRIFPNNRLQRFDFINDPVTTLAPYVLGFERAGTRVYYNDINTATFNANERSEAEMIAIIPGVINAVKNTVGDFINEKSGNRLQLDNLLGNSTMCYHHPLWYLEAAYRQLAARERAGLPKPLELPDAGSEGCDLLTVERGKTSDPLAIGNTIVKGVLDDIKAAVDETLEKLSFSASTVINNVTGFAIPAGDYHIQSYASRNRLGLNEQDGMSNGSEMRLTTSKSKVKIERAGTVGYTIQFGTKTVTNNFFGVITADTKTYVLDSESESLYQEGSSEIQLWEKNNLPGFNANQRWLFIQVPGHPFKYIIKNIANGKVLDANNDCVKDNSCRIKTYKSVSDDQTQIWVLQKID